MDPETPERAIHAFEQLHGLRVTVHDLHGSLWPFLLPDRFQHSQPVCQAVKRLGREPLCSAFSVRRLQGEIADYPEGRIQVCHAGLVEWTVPTFRDQSLEWVVFAGVRLAAPGLREAVWDNQRPLPSGFWNEGVDQPGAVAQSEADTILEHLRQLTARLWLWRLQLSSWPLAGAVKNPRAAGMEGSSNGGTSGGSARGRNAGPAANSVAQRRTLIRQFITDRHTGPLHLEDLAARLGLSACRTSHVVTESCGATFQQLLAQARLRTALGLLRHSDLPVVEVALRSGFDDIRHFHRIFRREMGITPLKYRKTARA